MFHRSAKAVCCLLLCLLLLAGPVLAQTGAVVLSATELTLNVGQSKTLTAQTQPADAAISWSSDAPEVASVDQLGVVTALAPGQSHIIGVSGGTAALCAVTVTQIAAVPVTGVTLVQPQAQSVSTGFQLGAEIEPENATDQAVLWSSSDEAVATVTQEGYVSLVGAGPVNITVTTHDGGYTALLSLTVKSTVTQVAGISLGRHMIQLSQGSTAFLVVSLQPENATDQAVLWSSSNEAVAAVTDTGAITAVASGVAAITATTHDGGFSDVCYVIIPPENGAVALESITLNHEALTLELNSTTFLRQTLRPADACQTVYWVSDNPGVAAVDQQGVVTALGCGAASITAVAAGGLQAVCQVTVPSPYASEPAPPAFDLYSVAPDADSPFAFQSDYQGFTDVDEAAWYGSQRQGVVQTAVCLGIMNGYTDGSFSPEGSIRLSEVIKMAATVHNLYHGGFTVFESSSVPWYDTYVQYAIKNEIIRADDFAVYARTATRAEMAYIFASALPEACLTALNPGVSVPDVSVADAYASQILLLYQAGVLTGDAGSRAFRPDDPVSRAEAAAIISRVCLPAMRVTLS